MQGTAILLLPVVALSRSAAHAGALSAEERSESVTFTKAAVLPGVTHRGIEAASWAAVTVSASHGRTATRPVWLRSAAAASGGHRNLVW